MSNIYRVEKSELPVVIFQADGSVMKGVVFLSARAFNHMGQETLEDLLKEDGAFFPFRSEASDFCVTNKASITHIRFEPQDVAPSYEPLGERVDVEIRFVGGEQLLGSVLIEMPEGRSRLFDFINSTTGFFLLSSQESDYMVNVSQIRDISPRK
ncbi:MAG: hypothetical protein OET90_02485 [Desulfuromonadales bacterium]|nr:hypothetical protein [Desulfuromonadales bacterium]